MRFHIKTTDIIQRTKHNPMIRTIKNVGILRRDVVNMEKNAGLIMSRKITAMVK